MLEPRSIAKLLRRCVCVCVHVQVQVLSRLVVTRGASSGTPSWSPTPTPAARSTPTPAPRSSATTAGPPLPSTVVSQPVTVQTVLSQPNFSGGFVASPRTRVPLSGNRPY